MGLLLRVSPLDTTFSFDPSEPFSAAQGWLVDDGSLVTNFSGVSSVTAGTGVLALAVNRAVQAVSDRGSPPPPYVLRRVPATGIVQTRVASCAGLAAQPNSFCGIVAYHAGQSAHLFFCGMFRRVGQAPQLAVDSRDGNTLGVIDGAWGDGTELQLVRNALSGAWTCSGRTSQAQPWAAAPAISFSDASPGMASFDEGDIWIGVAIQAWGGVASQGGSAAFDWLRVFVPLPASAPATITGAPDVCVSAGGVQAVNVSLLANATSGTAVGLSSNLPYSVSLYELDGNGALTLGEPVDARAGLDATRLRLPAALSVSAPSYHVYARFMPPATYSLGLWLDVCG